MRVSPDYHIEDESNFSVEFVRNALRLNVMPQLERISGLPHA